MLKRPCLLVSNSTCSLRRWWAPAVKRLEEPNERPHDGHPVALSYRVYGWPSCPSPARLHPARDDDLLFNHRDLPVSVGQPMDACFEAPPIGSLTAGTDMAQRPGAGAG